MQITWKSVLVDFGMAMVSGVVTGLIAGWVLLRREMSIQLATDDAARILDILHSIENAAVKLSNATTNALTAMQDYEDSSEEDKILTTRIHETWEVINRVGTKAQYIRADKYRLLKAYLVLRAKRDVMNEPNEFEIIKFLQELADDVHEYVKNAPSKWDKFKAWFTLDNYQPEREAF